MNGFRDAVLALAKTDEPVADAILRLPPEVQALEAERPGLFAEWVGIHRRARGAGEAPGTTLYSNPMLDPGLIVRTLGRRGLVGAGTSATGYVLSQSENEALRKTGKTMIPLGIATIVGMRNIRRMGAAVGDPLLQALARSETGRGLVDFVDPELLLAPEARQAILRHERGKAMGAARGTELGELAAKQGPEADRAISDIIENEDFESAAISPAQTEMVLAAATRVSDEFTTIGRELVEQGQLAASTVAKREGAYLPRMYAEHLGDVATGAEVAPSGGGRATRIQGYKRRKNLPAEVRNELGEVREASFRVRRGVEHGYSDLAAGKLFTDLRDIPGTLHPDFQRVADDALTATQMLNDARAAVKASAPEARTAAFAEYRAAWGEARRAQRALEGFRKDFKAGKGNWQALPDTEGLGPLRGAVVQREVAMALNGYQEWPNAAGWLFRQWKKSKTVWNPGTHVGNTMSNVSLAHMAGLPVWEMPGALPGAVRDLTKYGPATRALAEAGVLDQGMAAIAGEGTARVGGDLTGQLRELARTTRPETAEVLARKGITPEAPAVRAVRAADAKARRLYNNEDNVFRVAVYTKAIRPTAKGGLGMTPEAAAEYVRHRLVNYRSRSPLLHLMRNTVFPFAIYPVKALPMLAASIVEHPERWLTLMAIGGAADYVGGEIAGRPSNMDAPPELRSGGDFGYAFPTSIQLPVKGAEGQRQFFDPSRWLPYSSVTTGAPPGTTLGAISRDIPGILQPSGPYVDIAARLLNRQPYSGEPWISPADRPQDIARKGAEAVAQLALPSALGFHAPRIAEQLRNRDYPSAGTQALGLLGLRPRTTRPFGYADRIDAQLTRELQDISVEYNRRTREAERNPNRVNALEDERARKEDAAYRRYERKLGIEPRDTVKRGRAER